MRTFFRASAQLCFGLLLLLGMSSCSESPAKLVAKKQADFTRTLDNLNAIGGKVSDQKLGSETIALPAKAPVMDLDDVGSYAYEGTANAQLFTVQDLREPDEQSLGMHLFRSRATWQTVKAMIKNGKFPASEQEALQSLKCFSNWRYAVVIKARSVQAPQIASPLVSKSMTDNAVYSSGTFTSGLIEGDVLVYDLSDAGFLGGFPFTAQNSANVKTTTYGGSVGNDGLQAQLDRDFTEQIKQVVLFGLLDRLPNDRVYMNGNLRQRVMAERGK